MPEVPTPPGYKRPKPDPKPSPDLPTLNRSLEVTLNDGQIRKYPTLSDYVDVFVRHGLVKDLSDLIENHLNRINEIFFQWVATGQLGCLFAVKLARFPRENRWFPIVQFGAVQEGAALASLLNQLLDDAGDKEQAAVVIFPDIETEEQIVATVNNLCNDPAGRWYRTNDGLKPDPSGAHELIGVRWILKSGEHVNYVLGFANLNTMPLTRRSPFPALFLRIREEKRSPGATEDGRTVVHLADLDSTFPSQDVHDSVSDQTKKVRANMVRPEMNNMAKAKVTFSVSSEAGRLLCAPRSVTREEAEH